MTVVLVCAGAGSSCSVMLDAGVQYVYSTTPPGVSGARYIYNRTTVIATKVDSSSNRERERVSEKAVTIDSVSTRRQAKRRRRRRRRRLDCNYQTNQTKAKAVLVAMLCVCVMLHRKQRRPSSSVTLFCRWIWRTAVISNLTVVKLLGPTGRVELALHLTQHAQQAARRRDAVAADRSLHHTHIIIIISSSKSQHCVSKTSPFIA